MDKRQKELIPYNHYKGIEHLISGREPTDADDAKATHQAVNSVGKPSDKRKK